MHGLARLGRVSLLNMLTIQKVTSLENIRLFNICIVEIILFLKITRA